MSLIVEAVKCPQCKGTGWEYSTVHAKLMVCFLCQGRAWVPTEACKGCGRPAFKFWPRAPHPAIVRYCGLEECLGRLVKMHFPKAADKPALVQAAEFMKRVSASAHSRLPIDDIQRELDRHVGPKIVL